MIGFDTYSHAVLLRVRTPELRHRIGEHARPLTRHGSQKWNATEGAIESQP